MDEVWARLGLIAGALAVAGAATWAMRSRSKGAPRRIETTGLGPGVYLFTSAACPDCRHIRSRLTRELGEAGFVELEWEKEPGLFHDLGVGAVPATLLVAADGSGVIWPGPPDEALARLGP